MSSFEKINKISSIYDVVLVSPFLTPFTFKWLLFSLSKINNQFGLSGTIPVFEPMHYLIVNLFGLLVVFWSIAKIRNPLKDFVFLDGIVRFLFFILFACFILFLGVPQVIWFFAISELTWAILQLFTYWKS